MVSRIDQGNSGRAELVFRFERGNDGIAVAAVEMWKSRFIAISKGGGKRAKTCLWFSSLSTARHFHGRPRTPSVRVRPSMLCLNGRFYPRQTAKNHFPAHILASTSEEFVLERLLHRRHLPGRMVIIAINRPTLRFWLPGSLTGEFGGASGRVRCRRRGFLGVDRSGR